MAENDVEKPAKQKRTPTEKPKRVKKGRDPEGMAIGAVSSALENLDDEAKTRVLEYVAGRFGLDKA